jgi:uncharacterized protein YgiM (DUF1202 family)
MAEKETEKKPVKKATKKTGKVFDCYGLNLRAEPSLQAEIVETMPAGAEVTITAKGSTEDFYKVKSASGADGFCLKRYINIQK